MMRGALWISMCVILATVALTPRPGWAQARYTLSFNRSRNVYALRHSLNMGSWQIGRHLNVSGNSSMSSTLTVSGSGSSKDRWTDRNAASWSISYPFASQVTLGVSVSMNKSSDTYTGNNKPLASQQVSSILTYRPFESVSLSQSVGRSFDQHLGHEADSGMSEGLSVSVGPRRFWGTSTSFSFSKSGNSLKRKDINERVSLSLSRKWTSRISTQVGLGESNRERSYYARTEGDDLETNTSRSRDVSGSVSIGSGKYFSIRNRMSYSLNRSLDTASDDSTNIGKWMSDNEGVSLKLLDADVSLKLPSLPKVEYGASYSVRRTRYLENRSGERRSEMDRDRSLLSMNASLGFGVTRLDSLHANGTMQLTREDTPDPEELSDRDELLRKVQVDWAHTDGEFKLKTSFSQVENHSVNLHASRSASNKRRVTYSLTPSASYGIGDVLWVSHRFDLSARYTNYDYDELLNPDDPKSNVSRTWSVSNSVRIEITKALSLSTGYTYTQSDQGSYFEVTNVEAVEQESSSHSASVSTSYSLTDWLDMSVGYSFGKRLDQRMSSDTRTEKTNEGVQTGISFGAKNPLSLSGSYTTRENGRYIDRSYQISYTHGF